jgi:uncharacterized UBP type Zn finger protein
MDCLPEASGFNNTGAICYLNSLVQALTSLSGVNKLFTSKAVPPVPNASALFTSYKQYVNDALVGKPVMQYTGQFLNHLAADMAVRKCQTRFGAGQEDSDEFFMLLLDMMNEPELYRLLNHKYRETIICPECKAESIAFSTCPRFQMSAGEYSKSAAIFTGWLLDHIEELTDWICPSCKKRFPKCERRYKLTTVP